MRHQGKQDREGDGMVVWMVCVHWQAAHFRHVTREWLFGVHFEGNLDSGGKLVTGARMACLGCR
jgi:hypothetical protein